MLPREIVFASKRRRCFEAIAELAHEEGLAQVQGGKVIRRARVSRTTFYKIFESRDQALEQACAASRASLLNVIETPVAAFGSDGVARVIENLLLAVAGSPRSAELCLVHSVVTAAQRPGVHDPVLVEALAQALVGDGGERELRNSELFVAEAIVCVVATRLRRDESERLPEMSADLAATALLWLDSEARTAPADQIRTA